MTLGTRQLVLAALAGFGLLTAAGSARAQVFNPFNPYARPVGWAGYQWATEAYILGSIGDIYRGAGDFLIKREHARQMRVDTRRKELEQWLWERDNLPNSEDDRERHRRLEVQRARTDPPLTEVWSAFALNQLLTEMQQHTSLGQSGDINSTPVDPNWLTQINVTSGKQGSNAGLFRTGKLPWPPLLRHQVFATERQRADDLLQRAIEEAGKGGVSLDTINGLWACEKEMDAKLVEVTRSDRWASIIRSPTMYFDARAFLRQFFDAITTLEQPDAPKFLLNQFRLQGKTVAEVVQYMTVNGLRFAPAAPGSETAYTAFHRAMAADVARMGGGASPRDGKK